MCRTTPIPALSLFFVLQVATLSVHIMHGTKMVTDGLPLQERGSTDFDILAGNDFLSVLLQKDTQSVTEELLDDTTTTEPYARETREANYYNDLPTESQMVDSDNSSDSSASDGVIIAVHVSASVDSRINKVQSTARSIDQNYLASEDHPSIVANNGKSELSVEEPTPVTKIEESTLPVELNRLQVQNLPSSQSIVFNGYPSVDKDNVPPFHHSLVYHVDPNQPGRARSVSYSTVIQDIQTKEKPHERKERNYETGTIFSNSFDKDDKLTTTNDQSSTTQKSWSPSLPKVYGRPEQNYEVDESVSVVTNGRSHGVQASKSKSDKDQKVGYVVEGRNYRKYRVEERTPDGFIVGEYGVVSHDDGSLRGVRYTADGTINPRLIYDALMKFLAL